MLENTPSAHITWHPWKRFAAAAYIWLGGTTTGLQQWARWHAHYAKHPPTWSLPDTLCLPLPARFTGSPARDIDYGVVSTKDLWPREAWSPSTHRPRRAAPPPAHIARNPHFNNDDSSSSGEESVDADEQHCPRPANQSQGPPSQAANETTSACMAMEGRHASPPLSPAADTQRPVRDTPPHGAPRVGHETTSMEDGPDNPARGNPTSRCTDDGRPTAGPWDEPGSAPQQCPHTDGAPGAATAHQRDLPQVERKLFGTPQPEPYADPLARPSTPPGPTAPCPGGPADAESNAAMAIDAEAATPHTPAEDPETPPDAPQQRDLSQSPPRTSPQRLPATPVTPASSAASPPTQPPHPAKRPHEPTGVTLAPQRKTRPPNPPTPIRTPPTLRNDADGDAQPQHDHAPFWGYDLLAPRKGSRYLLWQPGPVPLPQVDPTTACDRFGTIAAHDAAGSPSHVAQRAPFQHYPVPAQRPGDAGDEQDVGSGAMDHDL